MSVKTMNDLWALYEARHVRQLKSAKEVTRIWNTYLAPSFGARDIVKVNFAMVDYFHQAMKPHPFQANRNLVLLRSIFKYAQAMEILPYGHNPARMVRTHPERKRRRFMTAQEAPRLANELILREGVNPKATALIWLAIFTGARKGELLSAKWSDLNGNVLTLAKHKTDNKGRGRIIMLPTFALEKLNQLFPIEDRNPEGRIIPATATGITRWWNNFRVKIGCPDLRIHDLRHTFATYALDKGFTLDQIGEALGHTSVQTTKIYAEMTNKNRYRVAAHVSLDILHDMKIIECGHHEFRELWT